MEKKEKNKAHPNTKFSIFFKRSEQKHRKPDKQWFFSDKKLLISLTVELATKAKAVINKIMLRRRMRQQLLNTGKFCSFINFIAKSSFYLICILIQI